MQILCLKIGLDHTEFCAHQVGGAQIVQIFLMQVKSQTGNFLVSDKRLHIEYVLSLKIVHVFITFS